MYNCVNVNNFLSTNYAWEKKNSLAREVIEALEMHEIPIVSLKSDGAKGEPRSVSYQTINPFREEETLFFYL